MKSGKFDDERQKLILRIDKVIKDYDGKFFVSMHGDSHHAKLNYLRAAKSYCDDPTPDAYDVLTNRLPAIEKYLDKSTSADLKKVVEDVKNLSDKIHPPEINLSHKSPRTF